MYTEENKGFTIITNFGCNCNCKYCITKHHPILLNQTTDVSKIDWKYLEKCISESTAPTINLSGGGDPFFNWDHIDNMIFFNKIFKFAEIYHKQVDVHTRILPDDFKFLSHFRKIALSIESWDKEAVKNLKSMIENFNIIPSIYPDKESMKILNGYISELPLKIPSIRVINVLDERKTVDDCLNYIQTMKSIGVKQITFRQMFGNKKAYENFNKIKDQVPKQDGVMFLPDGEYHNYYFTTNNKLYPYFFGYTEDDRKEWMKKYENIEQSCN